MRYVINMSIRGSFEYLLVALFAPSRAPKLTKYVLGITLFSYLNIDES